MNKLGLNDFNRSNKFLNLQDIESDFIKALITIHI